MSRYFGKLKVGFYHYPNNTYNFGFTVIPKSKYLSLNFSRYSLVIWYRG